MQVRPDDYESWWKEFPEITPELKDTEEKGNDETFIIVVAGNVIIGFIVLLYFVVRRLKYKRA